jgi:urea transporter/murein DD-endopeptidase MepM/ murein hydrolase activator NlpD
MINYNAGISGVISIISAYLFAKFIGLKSDFLVAGYYTYNALLVGLSIGFLFKLSLLSLPLIIIAGILTLLITAVSARIFQNLFGLQILSIPFILVSTLVYLSVGSFTNLFVNSLYTQSTFLQLDFLPFWLSGYFKSLGAIIFMPNEVTGFLIATLVLVNSRIIFLLSVAGFALGVSLYGLFIGSIESAATNISSFNYILIAIALGGVFNIPSIKSYILAMVAVAISTLVASAGQVFWSQYGLPIFTLPFILITLSFVYLLNFLSFEFITKHFIGTPEKNLSHFYTIKNRFIVDNIAISLPFKDTWQVWQGFDGKWTHKGEYKYAYDFVKIDNNGKTFNGNGSQLSDYYAYGKEVLSPINGKVVRVINLLPDNIIGSTDIQNNWGNEIIIENDNGTIIKLAHFAYNSIFVYEGQSILAGEVVGLCGNSGNSPQPHIHIQAQISTLQNAFTTPFIFVNYAEISNFNLFGLPSENSNITNCEFSLFYDQITNFVLDEKFGFSVFKNNKFIEKIKLTVKMSESSVYYFECDDSKLYFGKEYGNFYFYSIEGNNKYLSMIYLALATMPISGNQSITWKDSISNALILNSWQNFITDVINIFIPNKVKTTAIYGFKNQHNISGKIVNDFFGINYTTNIEFNPLQHFTKINFNQYTLTYEKIPTDN